MHSQQQNGKADHAAGKGLCDQFHTLYIFQTYTALLAALLLSATNPLHCEAEVTIIPLHFN